MQEERAIHLFAPCWRRIHWQSIWKCHKATDSCFELILPYLSLGQARLAAASGPDDLLQWFPGRESSLPGKWVIEQGQVQGVSVISQQGRE